VNPDKGQFLLGSLTGAVSSKRLTEECKGTLSLVGNQASSAMVEGCLTARLIGRADWKSASAKKCVTTYLPNESAPKMDGDTTHCLNCSLRAITGFKE